jgi:hypothetical protein
MLIAAILTMALLAACGGAPSAESPTAAPEPTAKPTLTPRPTAKPKPTAAPEPTEEPTAEPEPTPADGTTVTQAVDMSNMQTYTYKTGIFSVDIPESWTADDRSSETEVLVRFTDETENGVVLVDLLEQQEKQSEEQLITLLTDYLDRTYSDKPKFSRDDPKSQTDGSVLVVWGYDVTLSNGKTVRLLGNSFVEQRDSLISVFTLALPDEQFDALREGINTLLNSYSIDTSVAVSGEAGGTSTGASDVLQVELGDLETYTYATGLFSIDVPRSWRLQDNSKAGEAILLWTDPTENGLLVVDILEQKEEQSSDQLVAFLQKFLNNSFKSEPDFTMDDPKGQSDGSQLIVWSYTATATGGAKVKLLGNSFIEQRGDKLSILTTAVPDEQFDTLKEGTDTIINSYSIDPSAALP